MIFFINVINSKRNSLKIVFIYGIFIVPTQMCLYQFQTKSSPAFDYQTSIPRMNTKKYRKYQEYTHHEIHK